MLVIAATAFVFDMVWLNRVLNLFIYNQCRAHQVHVALDNSVKAVLKNVILYRLIKNELFILFYAFFAKHVKQDTSDEINSFGYTKSSNAKDIFWVVAMAQLPTLPFIHFLIDKEANAIAAWIVTALTLWSVVCYWAQVDAIKFRPIVLSTSTLYYRFGLSWEADIPLTDIKTARKVNYTDKPNTFDFFISPIGSHKNIVLEFERPVKFYGRYFLSKRKQRAVISLDRPQLFLTELAREGVVII